MVEEIWKDIPGYPTYQVSNLGRIKSLPKRRGRGIGYITREKILVNVLDKNGYHIVYVYSDKNSRKLCKVHRLVLLAFVGESKL